MPAAARGLRYDRAHTPMPAARVPAASPEPSPIPRARMRRFLWRALPLLALLHVFLALSLLPWLPAVAQGIGAAALLLSLLLIPAGLSSRLHAGRAWDLLAWLGFFDLGLFSSTLVLTLLRDLLMLWPQARPWAGVSALLVPALALLVCLVGLVSARRVARVVDVRVVLPGLPGALEGFTIVQISDLHVGPTIKAGLVRAVVARVNQLRPDLIAVTGDVVDGAVARLRAHTAPLGDLHARHGAWLVPGNHDYYSGVHDWITEFERLGLRCLLNEHAVLEHQGARLLVAGVTDPQAHAFDPRHRSDPHQAVHGAPSGIPRILLAHQPRSAFEAAKAGFDLQLSGHTHGGQFWPWNHVVRLQQPFVAGLYRHGQLQIYVSRGTGYWGPPKRLGAPSEITRIRLSAGLG